MVVSDIDVGPAEGTFGALANEIYNECIRHGFEGIVLDFETKPTSTTSPFARRLCEELTPKKLPVYVPYLYAVFCPDARYTLSTAISGGSLREHLEQMIEIHGVSKLALEVERICMDFPMPSPTPEGKRLSRKELAAIFENTEAQSFYSPEMCCNYFTYSDPLGQAHFVLFDDARSITDKLQLARSLGLAIQFLLFPEVEDILPEITSYQA